MFNKLKQIAAAALFALAPAAARFGKCVCRRGERPFSCDSILCSPRLFVALCNVLYAQTLVPIWQHVVE